MSIIRGSTVFTMHVSNLTLLEGVTETNLRTEAPSLEAVWCLMMGVIPFGTQCSGFFRGGRVTGEGEREREGGGEPFIAICVNMSPRCA